MKQRNIIVLVALLYAAQLAYLGYGLYHGTAAASLFSLPGDIAMFIYYMARLPTAAKKLSFLAMGVAAEALAIYLSGLASDNVLTGTGYSMGILAVLCLARDADKQHWQNSRINGDLIWFMLLQSFLVLANPTIYLVNNLPYTYDTSLYNLDIALDGNLPVKLGIAFEQHPLLARLCKLVYVMPAAAVVLAHAVERAQRRLPAVKILEAFMVACVGVAFYFIFPAAGPAPAFGALFPHGLPAAGFSDMSAAVDPLAPRNCMPSLHMVWALLLAVNAWFFYPIFYKALFLLFAAITAVATLGSGEHYLIDLVVAVPVALMVYALVCRMLPFNGARRQAAIAGAAMTVLWIGELLWTSAQYYPAIWGAILVTLIVSYTLLLRLIGAYRQANPVIY